MALTGLLIVTNLSKIAISLAAAKKHVLKTLYIELFSPSNIHLKTPSFSKDISTIYRSSVKWCGNLDVRVIVSNLKSNNSKKISKNIDVLLFDNSFPSSETNKLTNIYDASNVIKLGDEMPTNFIKFDFDEDHDNDTTAYDNAVLGGTFDRLHIGHKIMLTEAVLRAKKRLVVGVTDTNMIQSKILRELILPVQQRIQEVNEFLADIDNTLEYEVVPIQDGYGPTKSDPNLHLLVVSAETIRGGLRVNELRSNKNMSQVKIHCIDLVELETNCDIKEIKISSSNQRIDLLGTKLRQPESRPNLPAKPYIIGMIGCIASGKSVMSKRFENLGAKVIDCDKLAHQLYEPNGKCFSDIITCFGDHILDQNGKIDRKKLGEIVFSNSDELEKLNDIVWPSLLELAKTKIKISYEEDKCEVVILEAAILLLAGWKMECHEIWSVIVPKEEAVKRLMQRNNLSETEAMQRINAQVDNETIVNHSNVVFSSQWSYQFSQIQAERAWHNLMVQLNKNKL